MFTDRKLLIEREADLIFVPRRRNKRDGFPGEASWISSVINLVNTSKGTAHANLNVRLFYDF